MNPYTELRKNRMNSIMNKRNRVQSIDLIRGNDLLQDH